MRVPRLWLLLVVAALSGCGPSLEVFRAESKALAGPTAVDCREVLLGADTSEQDRCFEAAYRGKHAFIGFRQMQGIDSKITDSFVSTKNGQFYRLRHDSNVCGAFNIGPGCSSRIFTKTCTPRVGAEAKNQIFECKVQE